MMTYFIDSYELKYAPNGWRDENIKVVRNEKKGIYREVTQELTFVKDGAEKLRRAFYLFGVNAVVTFHVNRFDKQTMTDRTIFNGVFDFSTFQDTDSGVKCTAIDGTISGILKSKENQKYNIALEKVIYFDGCKTWNSNVVMSKAHSGNAKNPTWVALYSRGFATLDLDVVSSLDKSTGKFLVENRALSNTLTNFWDTLTDNVTKSVKIIVPEHTVRAGINADYNPANNNTITYGLYYGLVSAPTSAYELFTGSGTMADAGGGTAYYEFTVPAINEDIYIADTDSGDEYAYFIATYPAFAGYQSRLQCFVEDMVSTIKIDIATELINWAAFCEPANLLYDKILTAIDPSLVGKTTYFDALCANTSKSIPVFTSGMALTQKTSPTISISLNDFFKALDSVYMCGMGVETVANVEVASIENADYFYDITKIYYVGKAKALTVEPYQVQTKIIAGYNANEYNVPQGRTEFNSEQEWILPIDNIQESNLDLRCNVRADHVGILQTILQRMEALIYVSGDQSQVPSASETDDSADNQTFLLECEYDAINERYEVNRDKFSDVSNVEFSDYVFNVNLSPRRNLIRHGAHLRSLLFGTLAGAIKLTAWDKNVILSSELTTETSPKVENVNLTIQNSGWTYARFIPMYFTLTIAQPIDLHLALLQAKENGIFSFDWRGDLYYGFLEDMTVKSFDRGEIELKLLACNSSFNTIENLIK